MYFGEVTWIVLGLLGLGGLARVGIEGWKRWKVRGMGRTRKRDARKERS